MIYSTQGQNKVMTWNRLFSLITQEFLLRNSSLNTINIKEVIDFSFIPEILRLTFAHSITISVDLLCVIVPNVKNVSKQLTGEEEVHGTLIGSTGWWQRKAGLLTRYCDRHVSLHVYIDQRRDQMGNHLVIYYIMYLLKFICIDFVILIHINSSALNLILSYFLVLFFLTR